MRIPSRFMPKHNRPKVDLGVRILFCVFVVGLLAWALATHPVLTSAGLVLLAATCLSDAWLQKRQLRMLASQRPGESICEFARSFDPRVIDTWVIRAVYEQLQANVASSLPNFPLRAADRLSRPLIFDQDDLDMAIVPEIAERTGRSLDGLEANPYFGRVQTVHDLVLFFNAQPRRDSLTAPGRSGAG